ncbi:C40 family peptidase [Geodermatophilus sp. YIM 151500]|uniref:C40 family peptidase n=1 Tax=Geodermatophilus sp. YIM 151500 TaxID=2984531 RepID=UPI0021E3D76C|nr:C40 family peptidase [Geodermatophilus sp. YIM 151500]MCV2490902.1 C40 family peptidase [Geodermatophilus sp. YIM 151500]
MRAKTSGQESRVVRRARAAAIAVVLLGGAALATTDGDPVPAPAGGTDIADASTQASAATGPLTTAPGVGTRGPLRETRMAAPDRVVVRDDLGPVATFTVGSRTVTLRGPQRTFTESTTTASVTTTTWVRLLPQPFAGTVDHGWLTARLHDTDDDVLEVARQYLTGAPDRTDASGSRIAGDASYGPLRTDGTREEGSDFNDYLGVPWSYATGGDRPEVHQQGALDCSGYVRAVFGHRGGVPLTLEPDGAALPRRAVQMNASAPGVVVVRDTGTRPVGLAALQPGDLVFFDASTDDGTLVDHVGILLGTDSTGAPRFLSSRKGADGPTMGDVRGRSILSGNGLYASSFRSARRL